nr:MAG TPA: hypothetical protein [Bacteriophage sp.]
MGCLLALRFLLCSFNLLSILIELPIYLLLVSLLYI